jgi:hypothetical protein
VATDPLKTVLQTLAAKYKLLEPSDKLLVETNFCFEWLQGFHRLYLISATCIG